MTDDRLALTVLPEHPTPEPGEAVVYAVAGEGEAVEAYVATNAGRVRVCPVEPPPVLPPQRLYTPGYHGPTQAGQLERGRHDATRLPLPAPRDYAAGEVVNVTWGHAAAGVIGWYEPALFAADRDGRLRYVGHGNADALAPIAGKVSCPITLSWPVQRGEALFLVVCAWKPETWTTALPQVKVSAFADPLDSGGVLSLTGEIALNRPSVLHGFGPLVWGAIPGTRPICAVVDLP